MVIHDMEASRLDEINSDFMTKSEGVELVPVYRCYPSDTVEVASLLSREGFKVFCPYYYSRVRANRHTKATIVAPILYFSGYLFILDDIKSPSVEHWYLVKRLKFGDSFASVSLSELNNFVSRETLT